MSNNFPQRSLKRIADIRPSGVDKHSNEGELPVRVCNYLDVYRNDRITGAMAFMQGTATPAEVERFSLADGDVVITKDSETPDDIAVPAVVDGSAAGVVCGYHLSLLRPNNDMHGGFLAWALRSPDVASQFTVRAQGVTRFGLTIPGIGSVMVPAPQRPIQQAIAAFLDRETSKIDALVAEQERLFTLLAEKRQAVIARTVTQGMDPSASMKDSDVEWLGKVPKHWSICALNYRYKIELGKMLDGGRQTGSSPEFYLRNVDVQWWCINTEGLPQMDFDAEDIGRYSLRDGDLLVCEGGEVGRGAIWRSPTFRCFYQKALHRVRARQAESDCPEYLLFCLDVASSLGVFTASAGKATIAHLTAEAFRRMRFPHPPKQEQEEICLYLKTTLARTDEAVELAQKNAILLRERRAALISAAVTGKIDVRGLVPTTGPTRKAA